MDERGKISESTHRQEIYMKQTNLRNIKKAKARINQLYTKKSQTAPKGQKVDI